MRYSYRPNDDEAAVAATVARIRNSKNGGGSNLLGKEVSDKDRFIGHYMAALSEISVCHCLNLYWSGCGKQSKDVGGYLQVRAVDQSDRGLLGRPSDDDNDPCVVVFVDKTTRVCKLLGWDYFGNVKSNGKPYSIGTPKPFWIIKQQDLRTMISVPMPPKI